MKVLRPAGLTDVEPLAALARTAGVGITTLTSDPARLRARVQQTQHDLRREITRAAGEDYLFVLEDLLTGELVGTCGVIARVGGFEPFWSYALETTRHVSEELGVDKEVQALHVRSSHKGPTEIGTLFLRPDARGGGHGRLLSLGRFLFIAAFPERFARNVIAEMRGVLDEDGGSPFWDVVGRHFFDMSFAEADARSARDKQFIADLMPKHPIYLPMLPRGVQMVVGQVHRETVPARKLLEEEGFRFDHAVDIFDAGPLLRAPREQIRTVRASRVGRLARVEPRGAEDGRHLVANERLEFRCALGEVTELGAGEVALPRDLALALALRLGDAVRWVESRPEPPPPA